MKLPNFTSFFQNKTLYIHNFTVSQFNILRAIFPNFYLLYYYIYIYNNIINIFQEKRDGIKSNCNTVIL